VRRCSALKKEGFASGLVEDAWFGELLGEVGFADVVAGCTERDGLGVEDEGWPTAPHTADKLKRNAVDEGEMRDEAWRRVLFPEKGHDGTRERRELQFGEVVRRWVHDRFQRGRKNRPPILGAAVPRRNPRVGRLLISGLAELLNREDLVQREVVHAVLGKPFSD
jgi:hypothetical protein